MIPADKQQAHDLLDRLPPEQMHAAVCFLEFLLLDPMARATATAPPDDEPVTEEDRGRVECGKAALARGEQGVAMEDMLAEFGLISMACGRQHLHSPP